MFTLSGSVHPIQFEKPRIQRQAIERLSAARGHNAVHSREKDPETVSFDHRGHIYVTDVGQSEVKALYKKL